MSRLTIPFDTTSVTVSLEEPIALTNRLWGVVAVRLVDELTGQPPHTAITLTTTNEHLWPRVAEDGLIGLVGIPQQVFPALNSTSYIVEATIAVQGYLEQKLIITLPADPAFPASFTPLVLPDLELHRLPVVMKGRIVLASGSTTVPMSGATVRVTGIWRISPPANAVVPAAAPNLVYLTPPVYAARDAASSHLHGRELPATVGDDKLLRDHQPAGSKAFRLNNHLNLTAGDILLIDPHSSDRCEWLLIQNILGGSTPDQEARIIFEHPTAYEHRRHTVVQRVTPQPLGPSNALTVAATHGDATAFLDGLAGLTSSHPARLSGGSAMEEYHLLWQYITTSNSEGFYRLPPISRVAQLELEATHGAHTKKLIISPDYEQAENIVDFVLR